MDEQLQVIIDTALDDSGINRDLLKIQKFLKSNDVELMLKLDTVNLKKELNSLSNLIAKDFNKTFNLNVSGTDVIKVLNEIERQAKKTELSINSIQNSISKYQSSLKVIKGYSIFDNNNSNDVKNISREIDFLIKSYDKLQSELTQNISDNRFKEINTELSEMKGRFDAVVRTTTAWNGTYQGEKILENLNESIRKAQVNIEALGVKWSALKGNPELNSEFERLISLSKTLATSNDLTNFNKQLSTFTSKVQSANLATKSWQDTLKNNISKVSDWLGATTITITAINLIRNAVTELKEVDTILTEISKTSDRSVDSIKQLGIEAVSTANDYGSSISGYLKGVQEMSRAGFDKTKTESLAELSSLTQSAGDLTADLANDYLIASDAAYDYNGNVSKLNTLLDGQNQVTNRNAVSMEELANATKVAANQLSNMGIEENELTALLGTGIATSREAGETVGRAVKGIMMNLQQVKGETGFDGEIIDEDALAKVEARCHSLGVELEYMQDGIVRLRDPMEILKELAEVYNSLPEDSADRAGIISDIGGKYRGNILSSILSNYNKYEKMLLDYEDAEGSALEEALKTANSWEGLLNQTSNNWTGFVQTFVTDDLATGTLKTINAITVGIRELTSTIGAIPTIGAGIGVFEIIKNFA